MGRTQGRKEGRRKQTKERRSEGVKEPTTGAKETKEAEEGRRKGGRKEKRK